MQEKVPAFYLFPERGTERFRSGSAGRLFFQFKPRTLYQFSDGFFGNEFSLKFNQIFLLPRKNISLTISGQNNAVFFSKNHQLIFLGKVIRPSLSSSLTIPVFLVFPIIVSCRCRRYEVPYNKTNKRYYCVQMKCIISV